MTVHVTAYAVDRYIERIDPVGRDQATRAMMAFEPAIHRAAAFGAHVIRLPNGARLVFAGVRNVRVVTVLAKHWIQGGSGARMSEPVCCGACGIHCSSPLSRACTRPDCQIRREDDR